jgi:hypothetical protein
MAMIAVLDRLGPPVSRQVIDRVRSGPNEWRLAYMAFGLFLLSLLFLPAGGIFLMLPAMLVSRACVEVMRDRGEPLGARRWLVDPAIGLVLAIAICLLAAIFVRHVGWRLDRGGSSPRSCVQRSCGRSASCSRRCSTICSESISRFSR